MSDGKAVYNVVTITAAINGWVVSQKGEPDQVFVRWEAVVSYIASQLTTRGQPT